MLPITGAPLPKGVTLVLVIVVVMSAWPHTLE